MADSIVNSEEHFDNGGAIALKGFNYQNAVACLIAIQNYKKENFLLYIETKDDIELDVKDKHAFIQVKSQNMTLNNLLKPTKKSGNTCIFFKNISKKHQNPLYHIVLMGLKTDQEDVLVASDNIVFASEYVYSEEQKRTIIDKLKKIGILEDEIKDKIPNCRLYFTPFKDNIEEATQFLIGCMNENNIKVDERGKIILNELFSIINQKAELQIKEDNDIEKKTITSEYLKKLFETNDIYKKKQMLIEQLLNKDVIQFTESLLIEKELVSILSVHKFSYRQLSSQLGKFDINMNIKNLFEMLYMQAKQILPQESKETIFALLIELYFDRYGEITK